MASHHARMHARYTHYHSYLPQNHASIPETEKHSPTLIDRVATVQLAPRATSSASDSSSTISPTIPIAVGICVPVVIVIVTFIWLHRRHVKKIAAEERSDPHKSLDFGLGTKSGSSRGEKEMVQMDFETSIRRGRGLSMDIGSPYLLPPEVQNSRESLNSLSRNLVHQTHDPYRPVNAFLNSGPNSARNSIVQDDGSSFRTGSTMRGQRSDGVHSPLVPNAQRMPFSSSPAPLRPINEQPKMDSSSQSRSPLSSPPLQETTNGQQNSTGFVQTPPAAYMPEDRTKSMSPRTLPTGQAPPTQRLQSPPMSPKNTSLPQITVGHEGHDDDFYDESHYLQHPPPQHSNIASPNSDVSEQFFTPTEETHPVNPNKGLGVSNIPFDNRRISVLRPLPPDDPNDSPEQRALRIRSFYKEYFNENDARVYQQAPNDYYEDYGQEYLGDGAIYDPDAGQFIVANAPYAEPITRRAMTPPPRGPPRFAGAGRHASAGSSPNMPPGRARAFSSASAGGNGGFRGRQPKRQAPPPGPLRNLPTPHLLKEDAFSLPIDFAPPVRIRDQAAGRSASPKMESRPFSPQVAIASPLASSFNELPVMPSPHHLRRSGTFTALDFAPPPRFRNADGGSDAGSIRSGRSSHSTSSRMQVQNIRAGAYRVSRIPKELVGTQTEFSDILKPTWKVGS